MVAKTQTERERLAVRRGLALLDAERAARLAEPPMGSLLFIGGHQPGYQQNRGPGGKFGPGNGPSEEEGGSGGGGSGGGAKAGGGLRAKIAGVVSRLRGGGGKGGAKAESGGASKGGKAEQTAHAPKVEELKPYPHIGHDAEGDPVHGGGAKAGESIHERSARLQQEGGLAKEVTQAEGGKYGENLKSRQDLLDTHNYQIPRESGAAHVEQLKTQYGEHQLGARLSNMHMDELRQAANEYHLPTEDAHGNPLGRESLVSSITAHATQGRYSANFKMRGSVARGDNPAAAAAREARAGRRDATAAKAEAEADAAHHVTDLKPLGVKIKAFDPYSNDAFRERALYGDRQLPAALGRHSTSDLREMARGLGVHPGSTHDSAVKAIADHVRSQESLRATVLRYADRPEDVPAQISDVSTGLSERHRIRRGIMLLETERHTRARKARTVAR